MSENQIVNIYDLFESRPGSSGSLFSRAHTMKPLSFPPCPSERTHSQFSQPSAGCFERLCHFFLHCVTQLCYIQGGHRAPHRRRGRDWRRRRHVFHSGCRGRGPDRRLGDRGGGPAGQRPPHLRGQQGLLGPPERSQVGTTVGQGIRRGYSICRGGRAIRLEK